jgi:hypothetical protein
MSDLLALIDKRNRLWTLMFTCLFGALAVLMFLAAADFGLPRQERAIQTEARV